MQDLSIRPFKNISYIDLRTLVYKLKIESNSRMEQRSLSSGKSSQSQYLRQLPSVDKILSDRRIGQLIEQYSHGTVVNLVRQRLEEVRNSLLKGSKLPTLEEIIDSINAKAKQLLEPSLVPVINASGVILHTNLGRAPLSEDAIKAMKLVAQGHSNLEYDLTSGRRGSRYTHVEQLLCQATGAQAGMAVNNNAAGVLLALSALAKRREVIVSRGQAVEIGGGFRIPEVMQQSGAKLVEVGTTNRTNLADYETAINQRTAALLRVHTSNFRIIGFTESVDLEDLAKLAVRYNVYLFDDLGSGCLLDTTQFGLGYEPRVQDSVAAGASLAFFSGDKLLGGPQAGLIVGQRDLIEQLKRHPLARALRVDKITIGALNATLLHYIKGEAADKVPVWRMISMPLSEIEQRANGWAQSVGTGAEVIDGKSTIGGGSLPEETLPTKLVSLRRKGIGLSVEELARRLRRQQPPLVSRIEKDALLLDPRTVLPGQDEALLESLKRALEGSRQ